MRVTTSTSSSFDINEILIHCFPADIALNDDILTVCSVEISMDQLNVMANSLRKPVTVLHSHQHLELGIHRSASSSLRRFPRYAPSSSLRCVMTTPSKSSSLLSSPSPSSPSLGSPSPSASRASSGGLPHPGHSRRSLAHLSHNDR